jgi:SAM-dependent methyltransferase
VDASANLGPEAFAGAAEAYAAYRPPYPRPMLEDLLTRASVGRSALLDLATGPGRIALDLAGAFETVLGVDIEPEMIAVAKAIAKRRGITNVEFQVGRAEDLLLGPESFDLVTIGEAFHRLDQTLTARNALTWLRPGGCLATMGTDGWFDRLDEWEVALRSTRSRWLARLFPDGWAHAKAGNATDQPGRDAVLRAAGFVDVQSHEHEERRLFTSEQIVGYLESTSICSRRVLGDDREAFETEVRAALGPSPESTFPATIRWGYTLARKPA